MLGTLFSIIIAGYLTYYPPKAETLANYGIFSIFPLAIAALLLFAQALIPISCRSAPQIMEQNLIPKAVRYLIRDKNIHWAAIFTLFFFFISYLFVIDILFLRTFNQTIVFAIWTIFLGISLDLLYYAPKRAARFHDPYFVVKGFHQAADSAIRASKGETLLECINIISESAVKAVATNSITLATYALDKLKFIAKDFLHASKGIGYHEQKNEEGKKNDNVGYILFSLFSRLELIFQKSMQQRLEIICSEIMLLLGKITIFAADYDISMANYPVHYLGKLALKAEEQNLSETANKATLTMIEVSKSIIENSDLKYMEIKDLFLSIISYVHKLARENFRKDKTLDIKILTQPVKNLKGLFLDDRLKEHPDTAAIIQACDAVIEEFNTLENVLKTMPPITDYPARDAKTETNKKEE